MTAEKGKPRSEVRAEFLRDKEAEKRTCKTCGVEKKFELAYSNGYRDVYHDESGRAWHSKTCPGCRYADQMKRDRSKKTELNKEKAE